jgi:hypothetical protein
VWNEAFSIESFDYDEKVIVELYDDDLYKVDFMTKIIINPSFVSFKKPLDKWYDFGKKSSVHIILERKEKKKVEESKQVKLEDSNVSGIGSQEDILLRIKAAKSEKEWIGAG